MRRRRVGSGTELVEIAAGTKGLALAAQLDAGDARVGRGQRERLDQLVTHLGVERIEALGPGQGQGQGRAVALHGHPGALVPLGAGGVRGPPGRELGPGLQDGVGGGLGHEPVPHGHAELPAQQQGQGRPVIGARGEVLLDPAKGGVALFDDHVAQIQPSIVDHLRGHADDDEGQAHSALDGHRARWGHRFLEGDQHGAGAFGGDVAADLGQECFGAEEFEDRQRLPCRHGGPPGGALGGQWRHGADRAPRPAARAARATGRGRGTARSPLSRPGRPCPARRAGRPHGVVAPRHHQLRRQLPALRGERRLDGRVAAAWGGHGSRAGVARARRGAPVRPGDVVRRRGEPGCRGPGRTWRSAPRCWVCPWPGSGRRARRTSPRSLSASAPAREAAGLLVVDLSALWAGPLCGDLLAAAGATVVKVESPSRPDGARRGPAAFFDLLNWRKQSVALDLQRAEGPRLLHALVQRADVVIEASRPRALAQLGISARRLVERGRPAGLDLHHRVRALG